MRLRDAMTEPNPYRRLRTLLSPLHPRRLWARARHLAHRLGYFHLRLWALGLHPRRLVATLRWVWGLVAGIRRRRRQERLTVAVDVSAFWEPLTGIGWYLYRLLEHLAGRDDVALRLYGLDFIDKGDQPPRVELPAGPAIEVRRHRVPEDLSVVHYYLAEKLLRFQDRLIAADRNQVLFAPNYFLPPWFDRCRGRLVATVHDLSVERVPETMRESTRRDLSRQLRHTVERAAVVLTDSETVRSEIVAAGLAPADRVAAVHLGPAVRHRAAGPTPAGTPEVYVLHVGTLEPRKDLPTLFAAWRQLRRGHQSRGRQSRGRGAGPPPLVLCGGFGWKTGELRREMADGIEEGWIVHLGYVADDEVAALYRGALLVVLASIYEGFGLPAVEAMSAGVPLVCSDIPVLREVAGEAALYAPPRDPQAWAARLAEVLGDDGLRATLARRGAERATRFDWRRTAEETVRVWREAAAGG